MTNDIGEFRIFAIPPGQYLPLGDAAQSGHDGRQRRSVRLRRRPTFPGTSNIAEAQKITVGLGQQLSDVNMALLPARMARVTGTVVDVQGRPMTGMVMAIPRGESVMMMFGPPAQIKADGSFTSSGLAPGRYMLQARGMGQDPEVAYLDLTVSGDDINGVRLAATRPSLATGRVIVDPAAAAALRPSALTFGLQPVQPDMFDDGQCRGPGKVNDDLTFEMKASPIIARITLSDRCPAGDPQRPLPRRRTSPTRASSSIPTKMWPTSNRAHQSHHQAVRRRYQRQGRGTEGLLDRGLPAGPRQVDAELAVPEHRRPDQDGRYKVTGLPPGEYCVIALDYLDQNEWNTPEFLDGIRIKATPFSINEGETKSVDLRITSSS